MNEPISIELTEKENRDYACKVDGLIKFKKEIEQLEIIKKAIEVKK